MRHPALFFNRCLNVVTPMETNENDLLERRISSDNGGRRTGGDRRNYSYTLHIPERRKGKDRRNGDDRRKSPRIGTLSQI